MANEKKKTLEPGRVYDLAKSAPWSEGAIVSRTLAERDSGTVTLFSFDAGQGLSEHSAPYDALVLVTDGRGEFTVGGRRHEVSAGQVLLMPAGIPHAVRAVERFRMLLTMLRQ